MMKEAETNAEEDKRRKEEVETRNRADQAVYQTERTIQDSGDKLDISTKQSLQEAIEDLEYIDCAVP